MTIPLAPDQHLLLIPVSGLIEVFHTDKRIDIPATLTMRNATGSYMAMDMTRDGDLLGTAHWCVDADAPWNARARDAMSALTSIHMIFTGPVMFTGLTETTVAEIVAELSRKE